MFARLTVRLLALVTLLLGTPRSAAAVCTAAELIAADPNCGPVGTCTISRTHTIEDGCTLDFGARTVILTGRLNIGSRSATIRAGSMTLMLTGLIDAIGSDQGARGGMVVIETSGAFKSEQGSRIDADGNDTGGEVIIRAGSSIDIEGRILAEFRNAGAAGGLISLSAAGDILLRNTSNVSARGGSDSDGGGEIDLTADGNVTVLSELNVSALDGGFIEIRAGGAVSLSAADASGGGDAGSGGCIDVVGGAGATVTGRVVANGSSGTFMTGGCGGLICIDGDTGTVTVASSAQVSANGASPDGGGGQISLLSLASTVVGGKVEARGPIGETCGGDICIETGLDATVGAAALLDSSGGDSGGTVEVIAGRNIAVNGALDVRGRQQAALGGDAVLRAGNGGTGHLRLTNSINVSSAPVCHVENGCGQGGTTDLFGCNVTLTNTAALLATGPDGGTYNLTARELLSVQGLVDAHRTVGDGSDGITRLEHPAARPPNLLGATFLPTPRSQALATCPMTGPTAPACVEPCPTCGDGAIDFPETCDLGVMPPASCGGCSLFCQEETCDDDLNCTGDTCLPSVGCRHEVTPVCTEPPTRTPTVTPTRPTATVTSTPSTTPTASTTPTSSTTPTPSTTPTSTTTPTATTTPTPSATRSSTPLNTPTATASPTATATVTGSATVTPTSTASATVTPTQAATATASATTTASGTATTTALATATATATATGTATAPACAGDCNGDGSVAVNELIVGVNIALGNASVASCPVFDRNGDGGVSINELILAVNAALEGC